MYNSSKAHSITLHSKNILFTKNWGSGSNNWDTSSIRSYLQSTFKDALPQCLQDNIATVERPHWLYNGGVFTSFDTIFLPSICQMGSGAYNGVQECNSFSYYTDNATRIKKWNGYDSDYYLSSAGNNYDRVHRCNSDGTLGSSDGCADVRGIAPALVIV